MFRFVRVLPNAVDRIRNCRDLPSSLTSLDNDTLSLSLSAPGLSTPVPPQVQPPLNKFLTPVNLTCGT